MKRKETIYSKSTKYTSPMPPVPRWLVFRSTAQRFPYDTRLNIYYQPLQVIDEKALADASVHRWYNQTHCCPGKVCERNRNS